VIPTTLLLPTLPTVLLACAAVQVVLPPAQVERISRACSRSQPRELEGTWGVSHTIVDQLEADLGKLAHLRANGCYLPGFQICDPGRYYRQYVGAVTHGRRLVYINALVKPPASVEWRARMIDAYDGGSYY
jgi:hypothetical protein